jgi:hypothetical protein
MASMSLTGFSGHAEVRGLTGLDSAEALSAGDLTLIERGDLHIPVAW